MKKFAATLCLLMLIVPMFAFAQTNPCVLQKGSGGTTIHPDGTALPRCVNQIYVWSLGIASLLALLMMVVGGYTYMTAAGNAERTTKGTEMIWSAIIGLALLFGAFLILNTINPDLVNFNLDSLNGLDKTTTPPRTTPSP